MTNSTSAAPVKNNPPPEGVGRKRRFSPTIERVLRYVTIAYALLAILYVGGIFQYFGVFIFPLRYDALFFIFMVVWVFLYFPATRGSSRRKVPWYDIIAIILGVAVNLYIIVFSLELAVNPHRLPTPFEQFLGLTTVALVLEGCRRTGGLSLMLTGLGFFIYPFVTAYLPSFLEGRNQSLARVIEMMYLFPGGIYGDLLHMMAGLVLVFLFFGSFLQVYKGGEFMVNLSYAIMGRFRGGPAKVAVVACSLFGMINGSGAANVAAIGPITIPMIKKNGYSPTSAAALVAVASNGGQIMPPVLGLAAFLMMEILGVSYSVIIWAAIIPALLYYVAAFIMIDMQAMKMGLKGLPSSELPSFFGTLKAGWTYIIPIATLVGMLISQFSAQTSCLVSLMVMIQVSYIRSDYRYGWIPTFCGLVAFFGFKVPIEVSSILSLVPLFIVAAVRKAIKEQWHKFAEGLEKGMATVPDTGVTIILAGILVSSMDITGVAVRLTGGLVSVAGGNLFFLLVLTAVAALILGIGLPTSAVYLLTAMLLAPALVKLGMLPIVAHFFAFYYGLAAMLSPPVCPVAFIAAGIAGAPFMRTGWLSMRLGIIVFIVPFMFAYTPALLMIGPPLQIVIACIVAFFAAYLLSAGIEGYLLTRAGIAERVVLFAGGILMMFPVFIFWYLVAAGFTMGLLVLLWQIRKRRSSSFPAGPTPA